MNVDTIVHETADTIKEMDGCSSIPILEEDKGDVVSKLDIAIAQQSLAIVVGWNGFDHKASEQDGELYGTTTIVVQIYEKPIVNRAQAGDPPHLLNLAKAIAKALDGCSAEGMDESLHFKRISPVSELDQGVITCDVEFTTVSSL